VTDFREVKRRRPPKVAVPAQHQDLHDRAPALSVAVVDLYLTWLTTAFELPESLR
jgi:hypothetical protein